MSGQKPEFKMAVKQRGQNVGPTASIAAWWREADGRLSGRFDKTIARVTIEYESGERVVVEQGDGKCTHFVNLYENGPRSAQVRGPATSGRAMDDRIGGGRQDDDDVPF